MVGVDDAMLEVDACTGMEIAGILRESRADGNKCRWTPAGM